MSPSYNWLSVLIKGLTTKELYFSIEIEQPVHICQNWRDTLSMNIAAYNQIADRLETGDLLFCHGIVKSSLRVEKLEDCEWSHVAMVVRTDDGDNLIWESTTADNLQDVRLHVKKTGP